MRTVFQLIRAEDGCRTNPVALTRERMAQVLFNGTEYLEGVSADDFVLCIMEERDEAEGFDVSKAPLLSVKTFCEHFYIEAPQ